MVIQVSGHVNILGGCNQLFIGNRIERCLSYDEKPLLLFQKLKDAKKNPVFMLKHIKDIRSPIAVAQQKLAARKAGSIASNNGNALDPSAETPVATSHAQAASNSNGNGTKHGSDRSTRPSALTLPDYQGGPGPGTGPGTGSARAPSSGLLTTGLSPQPGWPSENSMLSPGVVDGKSLGSSGLDESHMSQSSVGSNMTGTTLVNSVGGHGAHGSHGSSSSISTTREIPASTGISYAVAIYPYMAEQDDEFDVVVYVFYPPLLNSINNEISYAEEIPSLFCPELADGGSSSATPQGQGSSIPKYPSKGGYPPDVCLKPTFLWRLR